MKKLLLILLTIPVLSFAQNKSYKQYRDYFVRANIDSLQKVVDSQKNQPTMTYLHSLIELEMSRRYYTNDFGKDLENIKVIALQNKNQQGLAVYNLLKALKLITTNNEAAFNYVLKSAKYFEQQKDTSGVVQSNFIMVSITNDYSVFFDENKKKISHIFANILSYQAPLNDVRDKLAIIILSLSDGHNFGIPVQKRLTLYKEGRKLLDENPQFSYLRSRFYHALANVYYRIHDKKGDYLKKMQWCYLKSYQSLPSTLNKSTIIALNNLSSSYYLAKEFKKSEVYIKQAIAVYHKIKMDEPSTFVLIYSLLSQVQYEQKDYKNAYDAKQKIEKIQKTLNEKLRMKELSELLTKYDSEKKDVVIKNLELQKQVTEARTRLVLFILVLTCFIIAAVSYLALRLRDANKRLKKLTQSRDKLFTIISHDLRSPFNTYQRYSEIVGYLIKNKQYRRLQEVLKKVDELGLNLAALLNNLLEWSILQQKQIRIIPSVINIQDFFNGLLPIYRDMARLKELTIVEDFQDQEIRVDPHLLSLITRNLLDNAIKYTPEGNQITLQTLIKENDFVLTISNQGDSMTALQSEKIRALFNNDYNYEFGEEGLGIGLILIKEFVRTNAVRINFEHNADNLTTFEVSVPLSKNGL